MPTREDLYRARELYEEHEPRDLFYRVALELLQRTRAGESAFTLTEAVAVVLLTWNRRFYIHKDTPSFDPQHVADIDALLDRHRDALDSYHGRSIESLTDDERDAVEAIFDELERLLGPVGAAKALHVLAPRFFALWDRAIAQGAGFYLDKRGTNANRYWRWMLKTQGEAADLGGEAAWGPGLLKRIDEYHYCRYSSDPPLM
ncbi:MAG TPA: hypothetical protein VF529_21870 [Solirubrobacteraceae bacterium]|jgi:hypothetical protein